MATKKKEKPKFYKMRVKTGDTVQVIAGKDKGKVGEIIKALPKKAKSSSKVSTLRQSTLNHSRKANPVALSTRNTPSTVLTSCFIPPSKTSPVVFATLSLLKARKLEC